MSQTSDRVLLPQPNEQQTEVIYLSSERDQVILGTAGSGKTLMAVHRAVYLANTDLDHGGPTLLVTFNKALTSYLTHLANRASPTLEIRNYHHVARGYLAARGQMRYGDVLDWSLRTRAVGTAIEAVRQQGNSSDFLSRPIGFFEDELDWISGHGYRDKDTYLAAKRRGRLEPLQAGQRELVWQVREAYHSRRAELGRRYDWWDLPSAMRDALVLDTTPRMYRHVVIDEAQDLPPEALRSLRELIPSGGTVTLFADYAQQLYGQRTSWAACGFNISKIEEFKENFRNSPGIAKLAIATAELPHFRDRADLVVPTSPRVAGIQPTLYRASSDADELAIVRAQAKQFASSGRVAILTRTHRAARLVARGLKHQIISEDQTWSSEPGLYVGTYYAAKGLEFDAVIMPFMDADKVPDPDQLQAFGVAEAMERDARLIYVGITRARSELLVTFQGQLSPLLPAMDTGLWTVTEGQA